MLFSTISYLDYQTILNTMTDGYCLVDTEGQIHDVNEAYVRLSQYSREELLNMKIFDLEASETVAETKAHIERVLAKGSDRFISEHKDKLGRIFPVEVSVTFWKQRNLFIAFVRDIFSCLQNEQILEIALKAGLTGAWSLDLVQNKCWRSANHDRLFGYDENLRDWGVEAFVQHVLPDEREKYLENFKENLRKPSHLTKVAIRRVDNHEVRYLEISGSTFFDRDGKAYRVVGVTRDVTDSVISQQVVIQNSKMASLGEMASGIAHEINNPLTVIISKMRKLLVQVREGSYDNSQLLLEFEKVCHMSERISKVVRALRTFARDGVSDPMVPVQISTIITETLEMCQEKFSNNFIELERDYDSDFVVSCRAVEISQVLLNLLNNAFDAVQVLNEKWVKVQVKKDASCVQLRVTDSGNGIPAKILNRIMEPFFTTKEVGRGTGVGLSISKGIIERHKGRLFVDTSCSHTCFVIELPECKI